MLNPGGLEEARAGATAQLSVGGAVGLQGLPLLQKLCSDSGSPSPGQTLPTPGAAWGGSYHSFCFSDEEYKVPERLTYRPRVTQL